MNGNIANNINNYSNDSIVNNEGAAGLRSRPETLLTYSDVRAAVHVIFELITNGIDEGREGYGKDIDVEVHEDNSISVRDYGRGVPMDWNSTAGAYNWHLVYNTLYASAKGMDGSYSSSEGLNGIGCTAAMWTSDYMHVESWRYEEERDANGNLIKTRGVHYTMEFKDGFPEGELQSEPYEGPTGTFIKFKPSNKVFTDTNIPFEMFVNKLISKMVPADGMRANLKFKEIEKLTVYYEKGLVDYIKNMCENPINKEVIEYKASGIACNNRTDKDPNFDYKVSVRVGVMFNKDRENYFVDGYHNAAILSEGGESVAGVYDGLAKAFEKIGLEKGLLNKGEKIGKRDIENIICAVVSTECPSQFSEYKGQTKEALNNKEIGKAVMKTVMTQTIEKSYTNAKEMTKIIEEVIKNKELREKVERVQKKALKELTGKGDKTLNISGGVLECETDDPTKAEAYVIEGQSAKAAAVEARNSFFQAILPLRGKILNALKQPMEKLLDPSSIIIMMFAMFGCGLEISDKRFKDIPRYDRKKLRYNKIIIAADADVDGGHIVTLLIVMFLVLCPSLLRDGIVYMVQSPLFIITVGSGDNEKRYYAYTDEERDAVVNDLLKSGVTSGRIYVKRAKGLGENDQRTMKETVMNPKTRRLIQLKYPEDDTQLKAVCNALLGKDIETRRYMIKSSFAEADSVEF